MDMEIERVFLAIEQEEMSRKAEELIRLAVEAFQSRLHGELNAMFMARANRVETGQLRPSLLIAVTGMRSAYNSGDKFRLGSDEPRPVPPRDHFIGSRSMS